MRCRGTLARSLLLLVLTGCGATHSVQQSTLVTLPTAPPIAATSGRLALQVGAAVPTQVWAPRSGAESGIAVPVVQPDGAVSLVLMDAIAVRGFFAVGLGDGRRQITGEIPAPSAAAWTGGLGATVRLLFAEDMAFLDLAPSVGFAVLPSTFRITYHPFCDIGGSCEPPTIYRDAYWEVMPLFAVSTRIGFRPVDWFTVHVGATVRNQPHNEGAFMTGLTPSSSVSAGPIGLVLHGGLAVDFIEELGLRAEVQWPAFELALGYGPILSLAIEGRVGGARARPFGARL